MRSSRLLSFVLGVVVAQAVVARAEDPAEKQADEILAKMTLEEKVSLCHGNATFYVTAIPRLGLNKELALFDGPNNVRPEAARDSFADAGRNDDYSCRWGVTLGHRPGSRQFDIMFRLQLPNGMIPDVIWENGSMGTNCTKPPVMAWAIAVVDRRSPDTEFFKTIYPKLVKLGETIVIPQPQQMELLAGALKLTPETCIYTDAASFDTGNFLAQWLRPATAYQFPITGKTLPDREAQINSTI